MNSTQLPINVTAPETRPQPRSMPRPLALLGVTLLLITATVTLA